MSWFNHTGWLTCYSSYRCWHRCLWCSDNRALALKFAKKSVFLTDFQISKPNKNGILGFTIIAWSKDCPAQVIKHGQWLGLVRFSVTCNITILFICLFIYLLYIYLFWGLFGYWYGFLILLIHHCIVSVIP